MRLSDLIDPEKGLESLVKLALVMLVMLIAFELFACLITQLTAARELLAVAFLIAVSPVAYWVRERRRGRPRREARRGAERTPMLPHGDEEGR